MANGKEDIKYGTAQAKLNDEEALRVRYKSGTPLEGGKIAETDTVDLFSSATNIHHSAAIDGHHHDRKAAGKDSHPSTTDAATTDNNG